LHDNDAPPAFPSSSLAIKVLHPRVTKTIERDLKIMSLFAHSLDWIPGAQWLSFPQEVDVFGRMMRSQLDLRNEAQNLLAFERNFQHRPSISFPRPLVDYTSHDVLVEEYADAVPLESFLKEGGGPFDDTIASIGLDAFLVRLHSSVLAVARLKDLLQNMLLLDNFVHADLHPGNIMVKFYAPPKTNTASFFKQAFTQRFVTDSGEKAAIAKESEEDSSLVHDLNSVSNDRAAWLDKLHRLHDLGYQPRVVFIDTGLTTQLDGDNRRNFLELFAAVASFDGYRAGELMVERCKAPELVLDKEKFALKMQRLVLQVKSQTFSLAQIRISDILSDVLQNVRLHHVKLEGDFINTVLSILLLEGIGRQLDPNMDLFRNALPVLRKVGMQMNTEAISGSLDRHTWGSLTQVRRAPVSHFFGAHCSLSSSSGSRCGNWLA
jgi:aarF domain-containing kinase